MNQKGLAPLLIVILIALAVGGYLIYQKQPKSNPIPTPLPQQTTQPSPSPADETVNWKTYINKKYGFSFKYPNDWGLNSVCSEMGSEPELPALDPEYARDPQNTCDTTYMPRVKFWSDSKYLKSLLVVPDFKIRKSNLVVDGKNVEYLDITDTSPEDERYAPKERTIVIIPLSNIELVAELWDIDKKETFDQMLSTFKFQ